MIGIGPPCFVGWFLLLQQLRPPLPKKITPRQTSGWNKPTDVLRCQWLPTATRRTETNLWRRPALLDALVLYSFDILNRVAFFSFGLSWAGFGPFRDYLFLTSLFLSEKWWISRVCVATSAALIRRGLRYDSSWRCNKRLHALARKCLSWPIGQDPWMVYLLIHYFTIQMN